MSWTPWSDVPWIDGTPLMPPGVPEFVALDPSFWNSRLVLVGGAGWLPDGVVPFPTPEKPDDVTPRSLLDRPRGPSAPISMQQTERWMVETGMAQPTEVSAQAQLEMLNASRLREVPPMINQSGQLEQHSVVSQYVEPPNQPPSDWMPE
jgi:hypothetical protein